jgi:hypothetical protein
LTADNGRRLGWIDRRSGAVHDVPPDPAGAAVAHQMRDRLIAAGALASVVAPAPDGARSAQGTVQTPVQDSAGSPDDAPLASSPDLGETAAPAPAPAPVRLPTTGAGDVDLAGNRAGQAAAARAAELRAAHPMRSLLARFLRGVQADDRAWAIGAAGEAATARHLRRLTSPWTARLLGRPVQWRVLHAVPVGDRGADIDHVLIGPSGVYTINTKNHGQGRVWAGDHTVTVNGSPTDYITKSRHEARRAGRLLTAAAGWPVPVTAVLAVHAARLDHAARSSSRRAAHDVQVLVEHAHQVPAAVRRRPHVIPPEQVDQLYAVARRSSTWTTKPTL